MTTAAASSPLRLLLVGARAEDLAREASGHIAAARCLAATDLGGALDALAAQDVDAVICALGPHDGRRLFQIMRACYGDVWRVLVAEDPPGSVEATAAAGLADACIVAGEQGTPWHVVHALRLAPRRR